MRIKEPPFQKSLERTGSFHEMISIFIQKMLFDQLLIFLRTVVKYQDWFSDSLEPQLCIRTSCLILLRITQRHTDIYTHTLRTSGYQLPFPITSQHWI
jgi:hypothetical protein